MAPIEHRRPRRGAARPDGWRRLPVIGRLFVVLAAVTVAVELWPIANAYWVGATEWWSDLPPLLPQAARAGAMIALPAAVAWASPSRYRANAWLWKGALIVAIVALIRYPADVVQNAVIQGLTDMGTDTAQLQATLVNVGIGVPLAIGTVLGIWALGEGFKDAGARSRVLVPIAAVPGLAIVILLLVPSLMAGLQLDLSTVTGILSVVLNGLFVFVEALLAGRAILGAIRLLPPVLAWRIGALGATVLFVVPVISLGTLLVNSFLLSGTDGIQIPFLNVVTYFGWPAFMLAVALGMGRLPAVAPSAVATGFTMQGKGRFQAPDRWDEHSA